ncbi:hypothetical protein F3R80_23590 [Vibrio parahaemolyticus]|nr:hypothetical protein [Vibrio parahaemolyticus]
MVCEARALVSFAVNFSVSEPIHLLKVSTVTLSVKKGFWVWLIRFLRHCFFQVVSVTGALKLRLI